MMMLQNVASRGAVLACATTAGSPPARNAVHGLHLEIEGPECNFA
jgi:hypothetical protein